MPPITKIWLFTLKDGHAITDPPFVELWDDVLALVNTYTQDEPGAEDAEQHVLFQCENDPNQLVFITGYPSLEMNKEADKEYVEKHMKHMFGMVEHDRLLMIESDVKDLQLYNGKARMLFFKSQPIEEPHALDRGIAGWDVWQQPEPQEPLRKETWIHVLPATDDCDKSPSVPAADLTRHLRRIKGV